MTFDRADMHYFGFMQPLTGLWVAGGHIIYRYGSPDGLAG